MQEFKKGVWAEAGEMNRRWSQSLTTRHREPPTACGQQRGVVWADLRIRTITSASGEGSGQEGRGSSQTAVTLQGRR